MTYPLITAELDDRDDTYDPEFRQAEDYCRDHGTYIGPPGGADILCGPCEMGISRADYLADLAYDRLQRRVKSAQLRGGLFLTLITANHDKPMSWLTCVDLIRQVTHYPYDCA